MHIRLTGCRTRKRDLVVYINMFDDIEFNRSAFKHGVSEEDIMYNEIDEHTVNVFHAMKCQSIYYSLLNA